MDKIDELLTRGVEKIYPSKEELEKVLRSGKKLKLYQGFDPSMPSLHLGNFVGLMKLRQWQKLGHEVIFLVGDFTGMIGDPTDKLATRKKLTREETIKNSQSWKEQASKILDFTGPNRVKILFNSSWLDKLNVRDLIEISSNFTIQQMLERDMFQERLKAGSPIYLHEFVYPILVAIDCVEMDVDLELGGNDQTFNMLIGRTLMKAQKNKEKFVMTTKLLVDKDGKKVGKTTGNALFLDSTPENFYGGIMSFPDEVIALSFELLTEITIEGIAEKVKSNPMGEKKRLAFEVIKLLWGEDAAIKAQENFEKTVQKDEIPENIPEIRIKNHELRIMDLLAENKLVASKSDAKRLIEQGGVELNSQKILDPNAIIKPVENSVLKVGKRNYYKIIKDI